MGQYAGPEPVWPSQPSPAAIIFEVTIFRRSFDLGGLPAVAPEVAGFRDIIST
jgi:hypothetical protein